MGRRLSREKLQLVGEVGQTRLFLRHIQEISRPRVQYAGTASLSKELIPVGICWAKDIQAGDIIIKGGFPGHAETVVDVAENAAGKRIVLLAQSFMPAQEIEIFPEWIQSENEHYLVTPTWTFDARGTNAHYLRRFRDEP